ncbi:phenylalanine--tRNA ligase subunit alpha [Gammaproteobacteria bacterium]|nr:phenylalanine--tRNA ligase subunit alpha [Gammaproteobacteria bacterium]MDC0576746.1 phenylalanine--tRNA ligase subunit alpha [Gammaproteobacteria bacterium]
MNLDTLKKTLLELKAKAIAEFQSANSRSDIDDIYRSFLGKKGEVNLLLKSLGSFPQEKRKEAGMLLNELKSDLEEAYLQITVSLSSKANQERLSNEKIDTSLPGFQSRKGSVHPVSKTIKEICDFFEKMGFDIESGPEAEIDYYNFEALNVPEDHPAKDMHDTFYLNNAGLLRTHTSPVQIRTMEKRDAPHRIICPGKVYRKDSDLTHTPMFHQIEGLVVEEGASFSQLKGLLNDFLEDFFGEKVELRFRPSYFPFTEPSAEADIRWNKNWLEVLGCGMVHPNVLKGVGVDTKIYSGFAFGLGVERMAMLKYDIPDLRAFFENDIRFLNQF